MYYPYFITYIVIGFAISVLVFVWALKNGQFKDQQRARFLPLEDEGETPALKSTRLNRYEAYGLLILAFAGLMAIIAVLTFSMFFSA